MEPEALSVSGAGVAVRLRKQYPGRHQRVLRGTVIELSSRPSIQLVSSCKDVLIGEQLNGDALGDERPEQAIVPLVLGTLPWGGVPRFNSFVTVLGAQPITLEMARTPNFCFFKALMAPRSSGPKCQGNSI